MHIQFAKTATSLTIAAALAGCASSVKRNSADSPTQRLGSERIASVEVTLAPEARKLSDNALFSTEELARQIRNQLESRNMFDSNAKTTLAFSVTDFRVRGTFSAVF